MTTYGDLGALYGSHTSRTYGSLFDADETQLTVGFDRLLARVELTGIAATPTMSAIGARAAQHEITALVA